MTTAETKSDLNIQIELAAARALDRCDLLSRHSEEAHRITRTFMGPAMKTAHAEVAEWMRAAGLEVRVDAMGNILGRTASPGGNQPVLLVGSHLDTVRDAGKYDGILGVLLGIALAELVQETGLELPFGLEVVGFSEEEGVRFGVPYFGSHALAGSFDPTLMLRKDANGVSLPEAIRDFGLNPEDWRTAKREPGSILAYFEAHIEQGPVLEYLGQPLGVVSAIVGQSRFRVRFSGQPGHAGTLPMELRLDALAAAAEWILAVEQTGKKFPGAVATVGEVHVAPNAPNVVPGEALCSLDVRHADDAVRKTVVTELLEAARAIAEARRLTYAVEPVGNHAAVPMDTNLTALLKQAVANGGEVRELVSGAGHDAAIMAHVAPTAMLFLRSPGGLSHSPKESVLADDVTAALGAMWRFLELMRTEYSA